jgi:hypothetical protein
MKIFMVFDMKSLRIDIELIMMRHIEEIISM